MCFGCLELGSEVSYSFNLIKFYCVVNFNRNVCFYCSRILFKTLGAKLIQKYFTVIKKQHDQVRTYRKFGLGL